MDNKESEILTELANAVVAMDLEKVKSFSYQALEFGVAPEDAILLGLAKGMEKVSELYREYVYYIPEIVVCGDTMYAGLEILKPYLPKTNKPLGKIVLGVVEGDCHDIGKNIVAMMLEGAGFQVYDLGSNVPLNRFIEKALEIDADIIAMSCLMTVTRSGMETVIKDLQSRNLNKKVYVITGGAAISPAFAKRIGADGYAEDACETVCVAKSLLGLSELGGATECV